MKEKREKPKVGILTPPIVLSGTTPLSNLIDVVYPNASNIYLISGDAGSDRFKDDKRVRVREFGRGKPKLLPNNLVMRALRFTYLQLEASYKLATVGNRVDLWIFFMGADYLPLAVLAARILGREVLILLSGNFLHPSVAANGFSKITSLLYKASRLLSDHIILYSDFVEEWGLKPFERKIIIAHRHFVDFDEFRLKIDLERRDTVIGYIGRLSLEKGILNFVEAIPKTLTKRRDAKFLIIGAGALDDEVRRLLDTYSLNSKVKLTGWIPHSELCCWLNNLKLLVLPSYTEGLPNTMLEAMACGTPVLATSVGAIPEVIKDKETGFLLSDNSPACIAEQIVETLSDPNLKQIVINARKLVESEFRYESAVKIWANVLRARKGR